MTRLFSMYINSFAGLQRNVWLLSIVMLINRSGSMILTFASLYLTRSLHYNLEQAGLVLSCYGFGSIAGSYLGGWLTDRKNHRDIMIFSLASSGAVLLLLLITTNLYAIATIIFFYGLLADMFRPANASAIAVYSEEHNRTRSVSLVRLAVNLGFTIGPAAGGFIALYLGYKWLFIVDAFTSICAALIVYFYLPHRKNALTSHERKKEMYKTTSAYRDVPYLVFIFMVALYGISFFQLIASVPQFFSVVLQYKEDLIGLLMALNGFLVVVIEMPLITWLEKHKNTFRFIVAGCLSLALSFIFLYTGNSFLLWPVLFILFITLSEILAMPYMMNISLSRGAAQRQGQYSALYSISYGIANIAAPLIGLGLAGRFGFDTMFLFFILLSMLIAVAFSTISKKLT